MEEKYTQMKIDIDENKRYPQNAEQIEEVDNSKSDISIFDEPQTIPIDMAENRQEAPLTDDDVPLVSPNAEVFTKVADNVNNDTPKKEKVADGFDASDWHDTQANSDENFIVDEAYASTVHADRQFMEAFGIKTVGNVKTTEKESHSNEQEETNVTSNSISYEYTDRLQKHEIRNMYNYAVKGIGIRLLFSVIFTALLFVVENITIFVKEPTGYLNFSSHPYIHYGISIGLLVLCAICAYEQVYYGLKSIISKDYLPESVGVVAFVVAIIHSVTSIILTYCGNTPTGVFNFVPSAMLVGTILYSFVNVVREEYGFRVISGKDMKFVLERVKQNDAEAEYDTFTTTASGDFNGQIARVERTAFVKNYFYNSNANVNTRKFLKIYYLVALLVPVIFAVIAAIRNESAVILTHYWGVGVMLTLPVGVLCAYSVPFYLGNKRLFDDGVAIIGEDAISEFASTDVLVVNDTTAFPPQNVKLQHLHVYNDFTIEKVLYYASNGFSIVGGPLSEVFDAAANESVAPSKRVRFKSSGRSHLTVKVDSETIVFGDKYGMSSQGIVVGNEVESKDESCNMYVAVNGVVAAKLNLKYEINNEFIRIVKLLNKNGTGIGIRSFDPNLNNELVKKVTNFKKRDLRIIKLTSTDEISRPSAEKDGKIVSKGRSMFLIKAIPVCKKILHSRKVLKAIKIISSIGGAVLLGLWVFDKLSFNLSAHIVGYHLVFVIVMILASLLTMPKIK